MEGRVSLICPVLVGRDDLLELADRRLSEARAGRGGLLFLAGEAGVGKTRLLGAIERRAGAAGFLTARGGTYPGDLEVAAAVLIDLARNMARGGALAATSAAIDTRLADAAAVAPDGDAHRRRRILALDLAATLAGAAASGPALIALEDLHQSDDLTLEILAALSASARELPLLVIGTYRSDELYPRVPMREWRSLLLTKRLAEEARLARLTMDGTATMASLLAGRDGPVPRWFVDVVHRRTDGIPLHVEELLGMLAAGGGLVAGELERLAGDGAEVPDTLEDAILGRVERRSARARRVAEVGAVIGRSFELDLLAATMGTPVDDLAKPLGELADHFLLAASPASGRYGFRHALICDAIYARIPPAQRRRLHGLIAEQAAARRDFGDAFLSSHYERAGRAAEAFATSLRAARAATALSAHREALQLYERALRNLPSGLDPIAQAALHEAHGLEAIACDDNALGVAALETACDGYLAAGRTVAGAAIVPAIVAARHLLGDDLPARAARLTEALASLNGLPASPEHDRTRARILAGLSAAYMLDRRLDESITYGGTAQELAIAVADAATERNASVTVGACLVFAGRMDEGWLRMEEGVRRSREAHLEAEAARAYRMIGSCASVLVEYERAERWLREGIEYAERVELWNHRHYMAAHLAHVLWATGRWAEAERAAEHALADGRGGITTRITALHALGYVALSRGELDLATDRLTEAYEAGRQMGELQRLSPALWGLAEVALQAGDPAIAIERCEAGRTASEAVNDAAYLFPYLVTGTRAYLAAHDPSGATRWVEAVTAGLRRRGVPGTLPAIDHAAGLLALASGSTAQSRASLTTAAEAWRRLGRVWEGTAALIDLAECELRTNRLAEVVRIAGEAEEIAAGLPCPLLVRRAAAVLGRARALHPTDAPWAPLTAREFEVARLIARGGTNASIAAELGLSARTIASHVEHILAKLGAERRSEIAAWATAVATPAVAVPAASGLPPSRPRPASRA